jgi:hypothetical protein
MAWSFKAAVFVHYWCRHWCTKVTASWGQRWSGGNGQDVPAFRRAMQLCDELAAQRTPSPVLTEAEHVAELSNLHVLFIPRARAPKGTWA